MGFHENVHHITKIFIYKLFVIQMTIYILVDSKMTIQEYYHDERDALIPFRDSMSSDSNLHGNWTGPPCHNSRSRWVGIGCSNSHVTHLTLDSINLTGSLPVGFLQNVTFLSELSFRNNSISGDLPNLTNLVHLEFVFLSGNRFSGPIPPDYINLPELTKLELQQNEITGGIPPFNQESLTALNVSYNRLSGQIPETEILERFPDSSFDHNFGLCGRPLNTPCPFSPPPFSPNAPPKGKKKPLKVWNIVLIAVAAAIVPFSIMLVFICCYKRFRSKKAKRSGEDSNEDMDKKSHWSGSRDDPEKKVELEFFDKNKQVFDLDDLLRASAEVLGNNGLGTTYKAMLESGLVIGVKRVKAMNSLSKKEFVQQLQLLGKLRHQNIVEILSFYYSKDEKLVIYEFVQDRSLFELLHENRGIGRVPVGWTTRLQIIKDIAKGLTFLHQSLSSQKVPHANLKSSNVLLHYSDETQGNQTTSAKLSDFGYLPLLPSRNSSQKLAVAMCPEFAQGKRLTHKADVYCFGVLLLEIITGKVAGESHENISEWVRSVVDSDWSMDILDMELLAEKEGHEEILKVTELALECTDMAPEMRPKMSQILMRLEEIHPQINIDVD